MNQQSATKFHKNSAEIPLLKKLALKAAFLCIPNPPFCSTSATNTVISTPGIDTASSNSHYTYGYYQAPLLHTQLFPPLIQTAHDRYGHTAIQLVHPNDSYLTLSDSSPRTEEILCSKTDSGTPGAVRAVVFIVVVFVVVVVSC